MLRLEDWAEIRRLHRAEGLSIKEIARRTGAARNTVRAALRSEGPPVYERAGKGSIVDAVEADIRKLLAEHPRMPATVIAERIGWNRSITVLKDRVRELRPLYLPPDPCGRTEYRPGELAQWDLWFPPAKIPLGAGQVGRPPVLVGVSGYSRFLVARMIPSREAHDVLCGHLALLHDLGGVPRVGVYDAEPALAHRYRGKAVLTQAFQAFRGTLGMGVVVCKPADPEAKGLVERANEYLETSFPPGAALRVAGRLQRPAGGVAAPGQRPGALQAAVPPGRPHRGGPRRDDAVPAGGSRPGAALLGPPSPRPLGAGRHLRLLGASLRRRAAG